MSWSVYWCVQRETGLFPDLLPAPLSGLGEGDGTPVRAEAGLGGSVAWRCALLGVLRRGAHREWRRVLIARDLQPFPAGNGSWVQS